MTFEIVLFKSKKTIILCKKNIWSVFQTERNTQEKMNTKLEKEKNNI